MFFLKYLADNHPQRNKYITFLWGIEEPESFLHPKRQRGVSRILDNFSNDIQVFITTHSSSFVSRNSENLLLVIEKDDQQPYSTKIISQEYEEARRSLGVSLLDAMYLNKINIITEGPSDEILLNGAPKILSDNDKTRINPEDIRFFPANNCNSACNLFESFLGFTESTEVKTILILDGDDSGQKALRGLLKRLDSNGIKISANKDYIQLDSFTEALCSDSVKESVIQERPSQINFTRNSSEKLTHFELKEGSKKKAAQRIIELSKSEDMDLFEKYSLL